MKKTLIVTLLMGCALPLMSQQTQITKTLTPDVEKAKAVRAQVEKESDNLELRLRRFDKNKDGQLDSTELALEQAEKDRMVAEGLKKLEERETARRHQARMEAWDLDKNGVLDATELALEQKHEAERKALVKQKLDQNKDGRVDVSEQIKTKPAKQ